MERLTAADVQRAFHNPAALVEAHDRRRQRGAELFPECPCHGGGFHPSRGWRVAGGRKPAVRNLRIVGSATLGLRACCLAFMLPSTRSCGTTQAVDHGLDMVWPKSFQQLVGREEANTRHGAVACFGTSQQLESEARCRGGRDLESVVSTSSTRTAHNILSTIFRLATSHNHG